MQKPPQSPVQHNRSLKTSQKTASTKQPRLAQKESKTTQRCPNCDTPLPGKARFCAQCGHTLGAPKAQTQPHRSVKTLPKAAASTKRPQMPEKATILTQRCPDCGTPLPGSARFCARCGHILSSTKPQISDKADLPGTPQKSELPDTPTVSMLPNTLKTAKSSNADTPNTLTFSPQQKQLYAEQIAQRASSQLENKPTQMLTKTGLSGALAKIPLYNYLSHKTRRVVWYAIAPIFARAVDPEPEKPETPQPARDSHALGLLPLLTLFSALGLFTIATAYNAARDTIPGAELFFWLGAGLIFLPALARLIHPQASRLERVGLLCVVALCFYLTIVALSPLRFSGYDEFLHWRTVNDILSTGHLFVANPLLPVSPAYPGMEIVTSALASISGLSTFQAGVIVIGVANLLMVLSLYLLCELLSGSSRLASIATIIYMTNPHFLLFDKQFAYESLAIPLATFVMYVMARYEMLKQSRRWLLLVAWVVLTAMILTHHLTNFIFEGLFLLWAGIYLFLRPLPLRKSIIIPTIIFGLAMTVVNVLLVGNTVIGYFTSFFADVGSEIAQSLGGSTNNSHQLFSNAGVLPTPLWERLLALGSVGLITLSIPFLLICFWRRYRHNTLVCVFAIIVVFYPALQVLRLTSSGAEASDRASAFVFIAISFLAAVAIVQFWPIRLLKWKQSIVISAALVVLFMGGIILGDGLPPNFMPGPYEVSADARSIDPEGIEAALWSYEYLGPNNRMYADRDNQLLLSVYGEQYLVTKLGDKIDVTDVYFSPAVGSYEISLLQKGQIHYLLVDMRLSKGLPQDGYYFEAGEPNANAETAPLNPAYLTKFATVPGINRLFDSGNIAIYDTGGLINAPKKP
ncbi:MAG TPA: zinc ribbon domain-containing protein [Ktedonobacteraceae bacterium]